MRKLATLLTGAALALLVTSADADAQRRGRGGVQIGPGGITYGQGYGQGFGQGYGRYNQNPGIGLDFSGGRVTPYYNPGNQWGNQRGNQWGPRYGNNYGAQPGYYNNRYGQPQYGQNPYYSSRPYYNSNPYYVDTRPQEVRPVTGGEPVEMDNRAMLVVRVPANAVVEFNGKPTVQMGQMRRFHTPELEPGWTYSFNVDASWPQANGERVQRSRKVSFRAGEVVQVDLMQPQTASDQFDRNQATDTTNPNATTPDADDADAIDRPRPADNEQGNPNTPLSRPNDPTPPGPGPRTDAPDLPDADDLPRNNAVPRSPEEDLPPNPNPDD